MTTHTTATAAQLAQVTIALTTLSTETGTELAPAPTPPDVATIPNAAAIPTASAPPQPQPVGADVAVGLLTVKVVKVETLGTNIGTGATQQTAAGAWWAVMLAVKNTGTATTDFAGADQAVTSAGTTYRPNAIASAFSLSPQQVPIYVQVAPDQEAQVTLAYDLPVGTVPETILLKSSGGATPIEALLK
ncbi:hypothetical protein GCM10022221_34130 [Actinocorallia aurea]